MVHSEAAAHRLYRPVCSDNADATIGLYVRTERHVEFAWKGPRPSPIGSSLLADFRRPIFPARGLEAGKDSHTFPNRRALPDLCVRPDRQHQRHLPGMRDGGCGKGGDLKGRLFAVASWVSLSLCVAVSAIWLTSAYLIDGMQWQIPAAACEWRGVASRMVA